MSVGPLLYRPLANRSGVLMQATDAEPLLPFPFLYASPDADFVVLTSAFGGFQRVAHALDSAAALSVALGVPLVLAGLALLCLCASCVFHQVRHAG